jgi:proteasome assembly chaperone (PAC2) family protein
MAEMERPPLQFHWNRVPELRDPFLVLGFHGWSNAGNVSSDTLEYLTEVLQPKAAATLSDDAFLNYTVDRPSARIEDGTIQQMDPMFVTLTYWTNPEGDRDLLFMLGKEPHLNWGVYAGIVMDAVERLKVRRLYTIGGVQDSISHSSPAVVTIVGSSPNVIAGTMQLDPALRPAEYHGPISIHSYLIQRCVDAGVPAVSLWGHVPAYVQRSPRLVARMVSILNKAAQMQCSVESLRQKSIELDRRIDEALAKDPSLKQFVETLESKDGLPSSSSSDEKVIRLNHFLRRDSKKDPEP